ncbi:aldehyde dehydrogenase family protein [Jatrophihabitans sp.]|uniref:aldehyde dehydrogenase family protein n=1 Tax=Jatrophihabitans sp. TaxID=1932789 RepID=UPI002C7F3586|nr:aldehyde dehydrogenase family protein [Jatrophihabitans sp.]
MIISTSPQRPDDIVVSVPAGTPAEVRAAAEAARKVQPDWLDAGAAARAAALGRAADAVQAAAAELTELAVREVGKPLAEARGEIARSVSILRYYAQQPFEEVGAVHSPSGAGLLFTTRRPRGVAGLITPWNFPFAIPLWKAAPALAYGNAVLLKPAEQASGCALRLHDLLAPVLPAGLFSVLPGDGDTGRAVAEEADVVSFTGSTAVGRTVVAAAAQRGIPVQAEMGGQNPAIVLPDADLPAAARSIAAAVAGYAGQKCTATKRVLVVGDPEPFTEALVAAVRSLVVGDPAREDVSVGPVIDAAARDRVLAAAESAGPAGGRVLTGGVSAGNAGWFVAPTVVSGLPADHPLECDEVFGPICSVNGVASLDEAISRANSVQQGLVAGLYTRDLGSALAAVHRLAAGMIKVNAPTTGVDFYLPFGGTKASGYGSKEQGKAAADLYTSVHTVTVEAG